MSAPRPAAARPSRPGSAALRARRERAAAFALLALGAGLLWLSAGRPWATALLQQPPPLPDRRLAVRGTDLGGAVRALALVSLAALPALVALRRWGRHALGVLLLLCGLAAVAVAPALTSADRVRQSGAVATQVDTGAVVAVAGRSGWPVAYALGGLAVAVAGGFTALRARGWPELGSRYAAGGTPRATAAGGERDPWTALDRGEDPTLR